MYIYQKLDAAVQPVLRGTQRSTRLSNAAKRGRVLEVVTDRGLTTSVWELIRWNCAPSQLVKTPPEKTLARATDECDAACTSVTAREGNGTTSAFSSLLVELTLNDLPKSGA